MLIDVCWACKTGLHYECYSLVRAEDEDGDVTYACCCPKWDDTPEVAADKRGVGRPMLSPDEVTDPKSTGRKRAAMLAPIFDGMVCEWARLRNAGGGVQPIVGCAGTTLADRKGEGDRHHGPDKNVLNNSVGVNLHRICPACHHRWHALNDPHYSINRPEAGQQYLPLDTHPSFPHDPLTLATDEDLELSTAYWSKRSEKRGEYPFPTN